MGDVPFMDEGTEHNDQEEEKADGKKNAVMPLMSMPSPSTAAIAKCKADDVNEEKETNTMHSCGSTSSIEDDCSANVVVAPLMKKKRGRPPKNPPNDVKKQESIAASPTRALVDATESNSSQHVPRRKRKRCKRLGFSSSRYRNQAKARQLAKNDPILMQNASAHDAMANGREQSDSIDALHSPMHPQSSELYPSTTSEEPWRWESVDVYFDPVVDEHFQDLERVRQSCANIVASNADACTHLQQEDSDVSIFQAMMAHADDTDASHVHQIHRGRYYRDLWEEEDFLREEDRRQAQQFRRKRPFAGRAPLQSYRELVRAYDDDRFRAYLDLLEGKVEENEEKQAVEEQTDEKETTESPVEAPESTGRRRRNQLPVPAAPPSPCRTNALDQDILPLLPGEEVHPASWGNWKLTKAKGCSFTSIHPASLGRDRVPSRWREEMDAATCESVDDNKSEDSRNSEDEENASVSERHPSALNADVYHPLPSFGSVMDEDEIAREIQAATTKLMAVSMSCWRQAGILTERAEAYQQVACIMEQEQAVEKRLEDLYLELYPPPRERSTPEGEVRRIRTIELRSRPPDLLSYSVRDERKSSLEAEAVAASVEFALKLRVGDCIDVLDHKGCWNEGVVMDLFVEADLILKYVHVRLSLWPAHAMEWISATDGRILPPGVASGKHSFVGTFRRGRKRQVQFNRQLAHVLADVFAARLKRKPLVRASTTTKDEEAKPIKRRKRRKSAL